MLTVALKDKFSEDINFTLVIKKKAKENTVFWVKIPLTFHVFQTNFDQWGENSSGEKLSRTC